MLSQHRLKLGPVANILLSFPLHFRKQSSDVLDQLWARAADGSAWRRLSRRPVQNTHHTFRLLRQGTRRDNRMGQTNTRWEKLKKKQKKRRRLQLNPRWRTIIKLQTAKRMWIGIVLRFTTDTNRDVNLFSIEIRQRELSKAKAYSISIAFSLKSLDCIALPLPSNQGKTKFAFVRRPTERDNLKNELVAKCRNEVVTYQLKLIF